MVLAALGLYLVRAGATGATEFGFFGQQFKSSNVGIAAIFIGAATIVLVLRRAFKSIDNTVDEGGR